MMLMRRRRKHRTEKRTGAPANEEGNAHVASAPARNAPSHVWRPQSFSETRQHQQGDQHRDSAHDVSALLVRPDGTASVVPINRYSGDGIARALGCRYIRRWPYAYTLDTVVGRDRDYRYDVWVDEEARAPDREAKEDNLFASAAAHPLNEATGHLIAGDALLVSIVVDGPERHLNMEDWSRIHDATWRDDETADMNADGLTALCRLARRARSL
ncbi:hypothetical protein pmac_cds_908 [Pandoravirus macleodensis]|uniref:Uncharacterized protein n=1 Tax=Pandoravirus macleodensis TaxID=2107707 RepID=A0A2U7UGJ2_9VIRU|nr:hypothetical protein pmac_cds_908 [Pandoravirus macleodensis]AVK77596.1 hypothetical protein pmac_cds_908 [Pandoravirus macleodensis]